MKSPFDQRQFLPSGATPAPTAVAAGVQPAPQNDLRFGPDGRIQGLDGVLDQISESVGKQVTPLVRDVALPILQRDKALQREVGGAAGKAAAQQLQFWMALAALGLSGVAIAMLWNAWMRSKGR